MARGARPSGSGASARIRPPRGNREWEQFTELEGEAFATSPEATRRYIDAVRRPAIARFAFEGDRVVAGALAFPCEQLFGGRAVPAGAVASVCVAPERRGRGLGRLVMDAIVAAMRDEGLAVAPLWPSSTAFYRSLGWELAGHVYRLTVPAAALRAPNGAGQAVRDPAIQAVRRLRTRVATGWSGAIERPEWWWRWRFPDPAPPQALRFGWQEGGELTGFVAYRRQTPTPRGWGFDLLVDDFLAATGNALDGLASLLAGEHPLSPTITFQYGALPVPTALGYRIPNAEIETAGRNSWMLRVLDPVAALTSSGWPEGIRARVELAIVDAEPPVDPMVLDIAGGIAAVSGGGSGRVRISQGAFAAWFAGGMRASDAALAGLASGPDEDLATMDMLTANRRPWLPDMF